MSEDIVVLWPFFMRLCGSCRPKLCVHPAGLSDIPLNYE